MLYKLTWHGPRTTVESTATFFSEGLGAAPATVGIQKIDKQVADEAAGAWSAEVYLEEKPQIDDLEAALRLFDHDWAGTDPVLEEVPQKDWVAHSLAGLGIVETGRFILFGSHDADKVPDREGAIPIQIEANQAFGTGHHPTTEGCLALLDRFAGFAPKNILDLGCGSAVLAIAAAKLWDRTVLATDIDEPSIDIAIENASLNGVSEKIEAVVADGFDHPKIAAAEPFDFVFANILAGPLKEFAPLMSEHVKKNGRVMLAGLMAEQEDSVIKAYSDNGFRVLNRLDHETWPVLLLVRQ